MKFDEDCVNDYSCIVDTVQKGRKKDYISAFLFNRPDIDGPYKSYYNRPISFSGSALLRFILSFAGLVVFGIVLLQLWKYAAGLSPLGFISAALSLAFSLMLICFTLIVAPMFGDETKKILSVTGYIEAGVVFIVGLLGRFDNVYAWCAVNEFIICCFIDIFFIAFLVKLLRERKTTYNVEKDVRCIGYIRVLHASYSIERGVRYSCRISPIFEYDSDGVPIKLCYDEFSPCWNSNVPLGNTKIHTSDKDIYKVQPDISIRVLTNVVLLVCFTGLTLLSYYVLSVFVI